MAGIRISHRPGRGHRKEALQSEVVQTEAVATRRSGSPYSLGSASIDRSISLFDVFAKGKRFSYFKWLGTKRSPLSPWQGLSRPFPVKRFPLAVGPKRFLLWVQTEALRSGKALPVPHRAGAPRLPKRSASISPQSARRSASLHWPHQSKRSLLSNLQRRTEALLCSGLRPGRGLPGSPREALRSQRPEEKSPRPKRFQRGGQ